MKSTRRLCGVCCLNGKYHPRGDNGRVIWCQASSDHMWPVAPLLAKAGGRVRMCDLLGIDKRTLPTEITDVQADRWSIRCGWHPNQVWAGWTDAGLRYVDRVFLEQGGWRPAWLDTEPVAVPDEEAA